MFRAIRAAALSAAIIALTTVGCGRKVVRVPVVQPVVVEVPQIIPEELLRECPITYAYDNTVGEAVRLANVNTPSLEVCAGQIDSIRKLNDEAKKKGSR